MENVSILRVQAQDTHPLRLLVLRSGGKLEDCIWPGDEEADHWAVLVEREILCIASYYEVPFQGENHAMQLRGMATHPDVQGLGYGKELILATLKHYRDRGVKLIWCNAREVAVDFYRKLGFQVVSGAFDIEGVGTHYRMTCELVS